jgi:hypothetical protein
MAGNAGKGREAGSRNRRTLAMMALAEAGETPVAFAIRIMRDDAQTPELRMHAARIAAPYVHPRPQPEPRLVAFDLPEQIGGSDGLLATHEALLRATASGDIALEDARDISSMLETHRRLVETVTLEERISALEKAQEARP